jgi:SAM-dependent methyltransferase
VTQPRDMPHARQPHVVLDLASRKLKAKKIEQLLQLHERRHPLRMLEIGTGSGGIAHYFGAHRQLKIEVDAVDLVDSRLVSDCYRFQLVRDTVLPFSDGTFDVVLTNHVIEHVGNRAAQLQHLVEIKRVMRQGGVGYLAVPNRWQFVEPHYKLPLLSWWPHSWRSMYLKWLRGVDFYDCEPLQIGELECLFEKAELHYQNLCVESLRTTFAIERPDSFSRRLADIVPDQLVHALRRMIPTLIYCFSR